MSARRPGRRASRLRRGAAPLAASRPSGEVVPGVESSPLAPPEVLAGAEDVSGSSISGRAGRAMVVSMGGNAAQLVLNLTTGILTARLLEADGRGTFSAVSVLVFLAATLGQLGMSDATTYLVAKRPEQARSIAATATLLVLGLSVITSVVVYLVVPLLFRAQPQSAVDLARAGCLAVVLVMTYQLSVGLAAGLHLFGRTALLHLGQPTVFLLGLVLAAVSGRSSAGAALASYLAGFTVFVAVVLVPVLLRGGSALRPSGRVARQLLSFGARDQVRVVGDVGNTRLDMVIMPAFLTAAVIGHYSVAVSAASIVVLLFGTLGHVVSALATSGSADEGTRLVERTTRLVLGLGAVTAGALGVLAPLFIGVAYGAEFADSVAPLRLLLPGCVLWAAAGVVGGGLRAAGRPGAASIAQLVGFAVTAVGLGLLLPRLGLLAAAGTSTVAYSTVFVVTVLLLRRHTGFEARRLLAPSAFYRDARWLLNAVVRGRATTR